MKFKVTSACFYNNGTPAAEGDVLDIPAHEVVNLMKAGRGYHISDAQATAEESPAVEPVAEKSKSKK